MVFNRVMTTFAYALLWQNAFISTSVLNSRTISHLSAVCTNSYDCAKKKHDVHYKPSERPCCTECSCADACHETNNCCYSHFYPLSSCVSVSIPRIPLTDYFGVDSGYYMVTQPPSTGCISYREFQAIRLGNVYPVSSPSTKDIYINESMAECHGVMDGVKWNVNISCKGKFGKHNIVDFLESLDQANESLCHLIFIPPEGFEYNENKSCAPYAFDEKIVCETSHFKIPNKKKFARSEFSELCDSDFYSPTRYMYKRSYKNTFCHICAGELKTNIVCIKRPIDDVIIIFSGILDPALLQKSSKSSLETRHENEQHVCLQTDDCRLLHCPSFQQRLDNGTCIPQWGTIRQTFISISFKLIPQSSRLIQKLYVDGKEPSEWLESPWSSPWRITRVYREKGKGIANSLYVIVTAWVSAEMASLLRNTSNTLNKNWNISFKKETIKFRPEIRGFYIMNKAKPRVTYITKTGRVVTRRLVQIYVYGEWENDLFRKYPETSFTRLHFCQQVELEPHEYLIDEKEIYRYITGQVPISSRLNTPEIQQQKESLYQEYVWMTLKSVAQMAYL